MVQERFGYHNLTTQVTEIAWQKLCTDADSRGLSVAQVLNELLHVHYDIPLNQIPPRGRPRGKPRRLASSSTHEPN